MSKKIYLSCSLILTCQYQVFFASDVFVKIVNTVEFAQKQSVKLASNVVKQSVAYKRQAYAKCSEFAEKQYEYTTTWKNNCFKASNSSKEKVVSFMTGFYQRSNASWKNLKFNTIPLVKSNYVCAGAGGLGFLEFCYYLRSNGLVGSETERKVSEIVYEKSDRDAEKLRVYLKDCPNLQRRSILLTSLLNKAIELKKEKMVFELLCRKYTNESDQNLKLLATELCDLGKAKKIMLHPEARRRRAWLSGWMLPDRLSYKID